MKEQDIQNLIRIALSKHGTFFRANVGRGWTGDSVKHIGRDVLITNARPLATGLPVGFSDLFGINNEGLFTAIEVKTQSGKVSEAQFRFLEHIRARGGLAGVARSVDAAVSIVQKK